MTLHTIRSSTANAAHEHSRKQRHVNSSPGSGTDRAAKGERSIAKLTPDQINTLDRIVFTGDIRVIVAPEAASDAVACLRQAGVIGFDTEKRPSFRRGTVYDPAMIQLATDSTVYVFRINVTGLLPVIAEFLADQRVRKVGVAVDRDVKELRSMREFIPAGFLDLGNAAAAAGVPHHGLRGLTAFLLGKRLSKGARLTNWELPRLPQDAIRYAATDAWIALRIYEEMKAKNIIRA